MRSTMEEHREWGISACISVTNMLKCAKDFNVKKFLGLKNPSQNGTACVKIREISDGNPVKIK